MMFRFVDEETEYRVTQMYVVDILGFLFRTLVFGYVDKSIQNFR